MLATVESGFDVVERLGAAYARGMALHIIKLVVGVDSLDELEAWGRERRALAGDWRVHTRATPRRAPEVLAGGSIYRVIKGVIVCRQRIVAVETHGEGREARCQIVVDPCCVRTMPTPRRPFQGWRYLEDSEAPADLDRNALDADVPIALIAQLRELGAW